MTIKVPYQLRRCALAHPAAALLVPSRDPCTILEVCARLQLDPFERVFDLDGGLLLELAAPLEDPLPGAIRLRALAEALYIPVDATLVPALLDDEAAGLVRDRGLVFLPGGRVLLFDRHAPVAVDSLISAGVRERSAWGPLPEPRRLAERLTRVSIERPEPSAEDYYRELARDVKHPQPAPEPKGERPEDRAGASEQPGDASTAGDSAGAGVGRGADAGAGAGGSTASGWPTVAGLADAASRILAGASRAIEQLTDKIRPEPADHSALLRRLLREFREGDPARALRRAIPIVNSNEPSVPRRDHRLPWSDAIYRLADLLRRPGRGEAWGVRHAQPNVVYELADEYRKAAERAVRQGDFRRAAYIYGVLLADDRMAAKALERGGLHHDAAVLYLNKLNDQAAAATAFEAAGMVDRALAIHRQLGAFETAGDLLRRLGEPEAAGVEYQRAAAALLSARPADHLRAGQLLLDKAGRPDLAAEQFETGWSERSEPNRARCGLALARLHSERGAIEPLRALLDQADALAGASELDDDGFFYNELARLSTLPAIEPHADEIRDRTMLSLARQLRAGIAAGRPAGPVVSSLFARPNLWPAPLVSDAAFAAAAVARSARRRDRDRARPLAGDDRRGRPTRLGRGTVTAVCQATVSGELFVGFDTGQVVAFDAEHNRVITITREPGLVMALAVDPEATVVVSLRDRPGGTALTRATRRPDGSCLTRQDDFIPTPAQAWLTPILPRGSEQLVGLSVARDLILIDVGSGMRCGRLPLARDAGLPPATALLWDGGPGPASATSLLVFTHQEARWVVLDERGNVLHRIAHHWHPGVPESSSLRSVPIHWRYVPPLLDLVGLDRAGAVHSVQIQVEPGVSELVAARVATTEGGYAAAARVGANSVVAATPTRIDWLSCGSDRFSVVHSLEVSLPSIVACAVCPSTQETLAICGDGVVVRVK